MCGFNVGRGKNAFVGQGCGHSHSSFLPYQNLVLNSCCRHSSLRFIGSGGSCQISLFYRCGHSDFSGLFASRFGDARLYEFRSCGRNTGLSSINLGKGFLSQDFLRFWPMDGSRYDGHRGLKIICLLGGWRRRGRQEVLGVNGCYRSVAGLIMLFTR